MEINMAIATLQEPYDAMHGSLSKRDRVYPRMLNGRCIVQGKPTHPTPKQIAAREAFKRKYAGRHGPP